MSTTAKAQTVLLAVRVLEAVANHDTIMLSDLARSLGMTTTRTHRLLVTLEASGYLARGRNKTYRLGPKLLYLGHRAARGNPLLRAAAPVLERLSALSGETALLALRVGLERLIVDSRDSRFGPQIAWPRDARLPLYSGALGICLLSYAPDDIQEAVLAQPLKAFTPSTLTDRDALQEAMTSVRKHGTYTSRHTYVQGVYSIAAPILGSNRVAHAALSIVGDLERLNPDLEGRYEHEVQQGAADIASYLASGWNG